MRFATKILLLLIVITVGLSGVIAWVVTQQITASEIDRAQKSVSREILSYADRVEDRGGIIARFSHLLLEEPQVRAYLEEIDATPDTPQETAIAQLREEIFGRLLQQELTFGQSAPAFHVLVNSRGGVVTTTSTLDDTDTQRLSTLAWPAQRVTESGLGSQMYVALGDRLFLAFAVPLRYELSDAWQFAYFVGYEINDAWVREFAGRRDTSELRVLVLFHDEAIARSAASDAAERALVARATQLMPKQNAVVPLDFSTDSERFTGQALIVPAGDRSAVFAFYSSLTRALAPLRALQRNIAITTLAVVFAAIVIAQIISRLLAKPVEELVVGTERIARGEFNVPIESTRRDELGMLARSFNQMAAGLEQRDFIKDTFGKFVDPKIVESLISDRTRLKLGGERRVQTVLFADLENFTALAERIEPEQLFRLLNGYLEDAADVVAEHQGIVDKFIGDGVVAFWGPPLESAHAAQACCAALRLVERARRHDALCRELGVPALRARVGIATGEVLVGNIGSKSKYNYTVMGDVANLASRLEGVNKLYGTQILVTAHTAQSAQNKILTRRIDAVRVVGRTEPIELHEVLAEIGQSPTNGSLVRRIEAYATAMKMYEARGWREARDAFDRQDDPAASAMAARCAVFVEHDPGDDWDGVWNLDRK